MTGYRVIPADPVRDRQAIVTVWERNLPRPSHCTHDRKYVWHYLNSPVRPGLCWLLLAQPGDRVVGTAGLGLRPMKLGSRSGIAGVTADFAVDLEHRSLLPALMLQKAVLASRSQGVDLIYGLPNPQATVVFKRLGYSTVGGLRRYTKRVRVDEYIHEFTQIPYLGRTSIARLANMALAASSPESWHYSRAHSLEELPDFDARFDELWKRASASIPTIGERSSRVLHWRYRECPLQEYTLLGLLERGGNRLAGYAVVQRYRDRITLADLLTDEGTGSYLTLLREVLKWVRRDGAQMLTVDFHSPTPKIEEALRHLRFKCRKSEPAIVASAAETATSQTPENWLHQWHFFRGDID